MDILSLNCTINRFLFPFIWQPPSPLYYLVVESNEVAIAYKGPVKIYGVPGPDLWRFSFERGTFLKRKTGGEIFFRVKKGGGETFLDAELFIARKKGGREVFSPG